MKTLQSYYVTFGTVSRSKPVQGELVIWYQGLSYAVHTQHLSQKDRDGLWAMYWAHKQPIFRVCGSIGSHQALYMEGLIDLAIRIDEYYIGSSSLCEWRAYMRDWHDCRRIVMLTSRMMQDHGLDLVSSQFVPFQGAN